MARLVGSAGASAVMRCCPLGRHNGVRECFVAELSRQLHDRSAIGILVDICPRFGCIAAACSLSRTPACWPLRLDDRAELASPLAAPALQRRQIRLNGIARASVQS